MKRLLKKNQVIIYVIAIMLMTAGYLNYTTKQDSISVETSLQMEAKDDSKFADIGDATLVSSNDIIGGDITDTNTVNSIENKTTANTISSDNTVTNETTETSVVNTAITKDEYFTKSKLERETMYSQMIETYEKILNTTNASETQKQTATQEITRINETKNSIMICENLIKTKGFENVIVFVNADSISVIVGTSEIKQEEVAQIQNIVVRELKAVIENIHISTK